VSGEIRCGKHGSNPWGGWCICAECNRIYKVFGEGTNAPEKYCECGALFRPADAPRGTDFSARLICDGCVQERLS
jgi:hypothetical protein